MKLIPLGREGWAKLFFRCIRLFPILTLVAVEFVLRDWPERQSSPDWLAAMILIPIAAFGILLLCGLYELFGRHRQDGIINLGFAFIALGCAFYFLRFLSKA